MQHMVKAFRNNTGRRAGVTFGLGRGSPDILACVGPRGRLLGIECKTEEGKMSAAQKVWAERIRSVGGVYVCCRSVADAREAVRFTREGTMEAL